MIRLEEQLQALGPHRPRGGDLPPPSTTWTPATSSWPRAARPAGVALSRVVLEDMPADRSVPWSPRTAPGWPRNCEPRRCPDPASSSHHGPSLEAAGHRGRPPLFVPQEETCRPCSTTSRPRPRRAGTAPSRPPPPSGSAPPWPPAGSSSPGSAPRSRSPPSRRPRPPRRSTPRASSSPPARSCSTPGTPPSGPSRRSGPRSPTTGRGLTLPFPEPGVRLIKQDAGRGVRPPDGRLQGRAGRRRRPTSTATSTS